MAKYDIFQEIYLIILSIYTNNALLYLYNNGNYYIDSDHNLRLRDEGKTNNFLVCVTFMKTLMDIIDDIDNVTRELRS